MNDLPWSEACTFDQYVVSLIKGKLTDTPEFQTLLRFHGREKLERIWREHVARRKAEENACASVKQMPPSESQ